MKYYNKCVNLLVHFLYLICVVTTTHIKKADENQFYLRTKCKVNKSNGTAVRKIVN